MRRFVECVACACKAGSPTLCGACNYNQQTIEDLQGDLWFVLKIVKYHPAVKDQIEQYRKLSALIQEHCP